MSDDPDRPIDYPCPECYGLGVIKRFEGDVLVSEADCPFCDGTGRMEAMEQEEWKHDTR